VNRWFLYRDKMDWMDGQGLANESDGMRRRDGDPTWKVE
jgi:hypothetical protein